jgi:hypothetical protein
MQLFYCLCLGGIRQTTAGWVSPNFRLD